MDITPSDWINLGSAVGSLSAAGVALWLGLSSNAKNQNDAKQRAGLHAASIAAQLSHTLKVITSCEANCVFAYPNLSKASSNYKALRFVHAALKEELFKPDIETLIGLSALDNNCANRIASAFDHLNNLKLRINAQAPTLFAISGVLVEQRQAALDDWAGTLGTIQELLTVALKECVRASELAAPKPSRIELHGEPVVNED